MAEKPKQNEQTAFPGFKNQPGQIRDAPMKQLNKKAKGFEPPNLGKAIRLPVPDFNDANRPPVCLEQDFPIVPINALSSLEGNAGKPIYQMSKWWARRRSSIFRSLLIAAATQSNDGPAQAAKRVWDHYYCNHQKAGSFKKLRVLDCFMGGGTTLVEGARLGFQMTGVDLNPVAWFVVKNELACSDPEQEKPFFDYIEREVKPQVQPFYTTTCPRGHQGRWVHAETEESVDIDPIDLPPDQRKHYRWEGPEIIYTFWAKHGPCQARGCGHRTPIFRTPVIAEKKLTAYYIKITCPSCGHTFHAELGETRMAPGAERVVLEVEPSFTEISQPFAQLIKDYNKGRAGEKRERVTLLLTMIEDEEGLYCPRCKQFAGKRIKNVLERHNTAKRISDVKKKDFGIGSRHVFMYLLIHPGWLEGCSVFEGEEELGGYAGADPNPTIAWYKKRLKDLRLIEVRGRIKLAEDETTSQEEIDEFQDKDISEPDEGDTPTMEDRKKYGLPLEIVLNDGTRINTRAGTVPRQSHFTCRSHGLNQDILEAVKKTGHTAPVAAYALQCYCPQCDSEGYNYNGRFFKEPDMYDTERLAKSDLEWVERSEKDLSDFWPRQECWDAYMMRANGGVNRGWGYTHWWKMFNPRQLLVHTQLLRAIALASDEEWPLDTKEQALGAFQQYLRMMCMFSFWHQTYDKLAPALSNANFHPKQLVVETNVYGRLGYGKWTSCSETNLESLRWCNEPWELAITPEDMKGKSVKVTANDAVFPGSNVACASSTDLSVISKEPFDLVITDPPFGNNLFYADLADFFYVWLRIPLLRWYEDLPERKYFEPERTPHSMEAVDNPVEHPDDREEWEREPFITGNNVETIRKLSGNEELKEKDSNPLYRPDPSSDFYRETLTLCWTEAARLLKPGGLMAFTFHHSADAPWVDVLQALFDAGYILVATYPIRSDETKGEKGAFGSRKIEYDIIHVCRKRLEEPKPVSWAKMRKWVKEETQRLKDLIEQTHGKELPEADLRVILRGKSLEFYSRHYGQVFTGEMEVLGVRDALVGINQLLDDLLETPGEGERMRLPDSAEPTSRLFSRIFSGRSSIPRDELHKILRGTGIAQGDLEAKGWIRAVGTTIHVVPIAERFQYFTAPGRNRKVLRTDLDQAHFLIGAAQPGSGVDVTDELNRWTFRIKNSVDAILGWYAGVEKDEEIRKAARLALDLVGHWRSKPAREPREVQMTLFDRLEAEGGT